MSQLRRHTTSRHAMLMVRRIRNGHRVWRRPNRMRPLRIQRRPVAAYLSWVRQVPFNERLEPMGVLTKTLAVPIVALALTSPVGATTINIPAIHLHQHVTTNLDAGPAWWNPTGRPGQGDTIAIAGHRTTHTQPFHNLWQLNKGDSINVRYHSHTYRYVVTSRAVVSASNLHIADSVGYERLLLTACARQDGSPTSANYRIVIRALPEGRS